MSATVWVPLHFTLEMMGVVAAGLLCAWAVSARRPLAALGAVALGAGQVLHAGVYLASDGHPALVALRAGGIALLALGTATWSGQRPLVGAGLAGLMAGALWGGVVGGAARVLALGPHLLSSAGALAVVVWAWEAARPSVRSRVLSAFVALLGLAVVVAGGSVARVATLEQQTHELAVLAPVAATTRLQLVEVASDLARRASDASPAVGATLFRPASAMGRVRVGGREAAVLVDRAGHVVAHAGTPRLLPRATRGALAGRVETSFDVTGPDLVVGGGAPVFRPGGSRTAQDVVAALVLMRDVPLSTVLRAARALEPRVEVAVVSAASTVASTPALSSVRPEAGQTVVAANLPTPKGRWPSATVALGGGTSLVVAVSDATIVAATTGLIRALLVALLASSLLAVLAALWLSVRLTRPMLDLVEEGERLKSDFLASISHELRTPLTPIRGYTEILRAGRVPPRRATGYLDEIGQAARRLERIVTLLVDVASMEAGRFRVDRAPFSPAEAVDECVTRFAALVRRGRIQARVSPELPAVEADRGAIGRVLEELVQNALKFSPESTEVEVGARTEEGLVAFFVRDRGTGFDPGRLAELTRAFQQAEAGDTRRFGGLGLGLAFVDGVLRAHGTSLVVDSAPGQGAECSFLLPPAGMVTPMARKGAREARPRSRRV